MNDTAKLESFPPGTLKREGGEFHPELIASPGERFYSTVMMVATHFWEEGIGWMPIGDWPDLPLSEETTAASHRPSTDTQQDSATYKQRVKVVDPENQHYGQQGDVIDYVRGQPIVSFLSIQNGARNVQFSHYQLQWLLPHE